MTEPASRPGRRVSFGAAAVLAGYLLLAPPILVLAPFVLLTLASRPRTPRELIWLVVAAVGVGLALAAPGGLPVDLIRTSGLLLAFAFLLLSLGFQWSLFTRALLAVFLAALAMVIWEWSRGISWLEVQEAFAAMLREGYRQIANPGGPGAPPRPELQSVVQQFIDSADDMAGVLPGLLALQGMAAVSLAWLWHHRIATTPLGQPAAPFRAFRFNDQLVWGAIFTLALLLAPVPAEAKALAQNLMILWVGLYAMRGLAVAATVLTPVPIPLRLVAVILAVLLSPLALGICVALGLADTWLDIRGRLAPPAPRGA